MRHRVAGKKLNRTSSHRKALAMNLMRAFLIEWQGKGHIVTTRSKAKFIQPKIEKLISLSRNKTVHNVRRAMALIGDKDVVQVLFDEIGPYYSERPGGYTRVLRLVKPRLGDASVRAYLGYVREDDEYPEGDCRAKHAVEGGAAAEAVVSEEAASEEAEVPLRSPVTMAKSRGQQQRIQLPQMSPIPPRWKRLQASSPELRRPSRRHKRTPNPLKRALKRVTRRQNRLKQRSRTPVLPSRRKKLLQILPSRRKKLLQKKTS